MTILNSTMCQNILECARMYQYVLYVHSDLCFRLFQNKFWELFVPFDLPSPSGAILKLAYMKMDLKSDFAKLSQAKPKLQLSWLALASLNFT